MKSFYAAQFREPFYVFVTKQSLKIFGQQDIAVSFGSAFFSVLAVGATYLLGVAAFSWPVGVLGMLLMTIEQEVISLGVDGWRDDTFMFLVLMSAYGFVRLLKKSSFGNAIFTAFACAGACLTRLTSFSFIFPAFLFLAFFSVEPSLQRRLKTIGLSLFLFGIFIAPFLINCAIVYGDPLFSINDNTKFYRARENIDAETPMPVSQYLLGKLREKPIKLIDTGFVGLTAYPFENKWKGFDYLFPDFGGWLWLFSITGLFLFLLSNQGRLLLVLLITSLVPYAFTWQILGGSEWRFTLHAYPFYLLAASLSIIAVLTIPHPRRLWTCIFDFIPARKKIVTSLLLLLVGFLVLWFLLNELNYLRKLEAVNAGDSIIVEPGVRDAFFFKRGWFSAVNIQQNRVRINKGKSMEASLPLSKRQKYFLLFGLNRLFPEDKYLLGMSVSLNGRPLDKILIHQNEPLLTARKVKVPADRVLDGRNVIGFEPLYSIAELPEVTLSDPLQFSYIKAQVMDSYQSGVEKYKAGDFEGAVADLEKALQTEKQKSAAYYYLGMSQLELGMPAKAISSFTEALRLSRGNPAILEARGKTFASVGQYDPAIRDLQKVLKQQPENIEANYYLAMALRGTGNIHEANLFLEKILEINPQDPYALKARQELGR
jgi:tetratricopeptide (TPR) repeat protein